MGMIGTIRLPRGNTDECEIKGVTLGQVERCLLAAERNRDLFHEFVKFPTWRFPFLLWNIAQVHFSHEPVVSDGALQTRENRLRAAISPAASASLIRSARRGRRACRREREFFRSGI